MRGGKLTEGGVGVDGFIWFHMGNAGDYFVRLVMMIIILIVIIYLCYGQ